jgi:hypothetical protein
VKPGGDYRQNQRDRQRDRKLPWGDFASMMTPGHMAKSGDVWDCHNWGWSTHREKAQHRPAWEASSPIQGLCL